MAEQFRLLRKPEVLKLCGLARSTFHERINDGLFTPPVSLGGRAVAWPSYEVDIILKAMIASYDKDRIKSIVVDLISKRGEL